MVPLANGRGGRRAEERVNPTVRLDVASKCSYTSNAQFCHTRQFITFYLFALAVARPLYSKHAPSERNAPL
jgi:hypothetical protein